MQDHFEPLSIKTFVMQFYFTLTRGFFSETEADSFLKIEHESITLLQQMKGLSRADNNYAYEKTLLPSIDELTRKAKGFLKYTQIASDKAIATYLATNPQFFSEGIDLKSLRSLVDIDVLFRNGYMLHDVFLGYPKKDLYQFRIDCLDFVHSAAHFYNEAYDYYHERKKVVLYSDTPLSEMKPFELTRIQDREEVMFRNFREAYINIIIFIESFINSVGYDAYLAGKATSTEDELKLRGIQGVRKNGKYNYSTIINKLEDIPRIIEGTTVDVSSEPYASYLTQDVELRNSYVHSSPDKPKPKLTIEDWKRKCDEMIAAKCQAIVGAFWTTCYPKRPFPGVIFNAFNGNAFKGIQHKMVAYYEA